MCSKTKSAFGIWILVAAEFLFCFESPQFCCEAREYVELLPQCSENQDPSTPCPSEAAARCMQRLRANTACQSRTTGTAEYPFLWCPQLNSSPSLAVKACWLYAEICCHMHPAGCYFWTDHRHSGCETLQAPSGAAAYGRDRRIWGRGWEVFKREEQINK